MNIDEHLRAYQQHRDTIEWAINRGLERSQRIVGTHASREIVELLSAYLHSINKVDMGFQINHRWFKSEKVADRFADFPKKDIIIEKMIRLENLSEGLTYGSQKTIKEIKEVVDLSNEIQNMINDIMKLKEKGSGKE